MTKFRFSHSVETDWTTSPSICLTKQIWKSYVTFDHIYFIKIEKETKVFTLCVLVIGMMWLTSWFASVDAKLYWLLHYIWKISADLLWFGVWRNSLDSAQLSPSLSNSFWWIYRSMITLDTVMVMVMDEEPGADNGGEQIKEGQKTGDGLIGQMWCTEYSSELFENSFYEPIKLS